MSSSSNWDTLWIALAGGAVGSIVTALIAYGARFWSARAGIEEHDRAARDRDEDLESWVSDRSIVLRRELKEISETYNKQNLFHSGAHEKPLRTRRRRHSMSTATRSGRRSATSPGSASRGSVPRGLAPAQGRSTSGADGSRPRAAGAQLLALIGQAARPAVRGSPRSDTRDVPDNVDRDSTQRAGFRLR